MRLARTTGLDFLKRWGGGGERGVPLKASLTHPHSSLLLNFEIGKGQTHASSQYINF